MTDRQQNRHPRYDDLDRYELERYANRLEAALYHSEMSVLRACGSSAEADRCRAAYRDGAIYDYVQGDYDG